jgi:CheY-like chemotaxis protein
MEAMTAPCERLVMIVEDDHDVLESLSEILADHDYRSVGAANGQEALDRLRAAREKPCVILLDMMMPIMDGWQFRALQKDDPELGSIPVVVLTAHAKIQATREEMQAAGYLTKPVQLKDLLRTIEQLCKVQQSATRES